MGPVHDASTQERVYWKLFPHCYLGQCFAEKICHETCALTLFYFNNFLGIGIWETVDWWFWKTSNENKH